MKLLHKYFQISKITMSNSLVYFWSFIGKNIFFVFILFIYLMLWQNIYGQKGETIGGLTLNAMIWYLIVTELVTLSGTSVHFQINEDVKSGGIAYLLNKPYSYVGYCFSYFAGEVGVKLITNGLIGIVIGLVYVGPLKGFSLMHLPFVLLSLLLGCCIHFFIYISIAMTSFWFEENNAFFWIYSKLVFTLGGMLVPLQLFPAWLKKIAENLPFAYVTYAPARLTVAFSYSAFYRQVLIQSLYLVVFIFVAVFLYRKGAKNLNVNGG